jgi:hypothetical protein
VHRSEEVLPGTSRPLIKQPSSVSSDGEASQDGERLIMYDICNLFYEKKYINNKTTEILMVSGMKTKHGKSQRSLVYIVVLV